MSRLSDELLARQAARGNGRAAAALYERYYQPLYRYCLSILQDESDAQDAVQSTFAAALSEIGHRRRDAPPRAWLFRVAHNEAVGVGIGSFVRRTSFLVVFGRRIVHGLSYPISRPIILAV